MRSAVASPSSRAARARSRSPARTFGLSERNLQQPIEQQNILFAQQDDPATHILKACGEGAALSGRPPMEKRAECVIHCQLVLTGEAGEFKCLWRRARMVSAHQIKQGRMHFSKREHADMGQARKPTSACVR